MQSEGFEDPTTEEEVPATQSTHGDLAAGEYRPTTQLVHPEPAAEDFPTSQSKQAEGAKAPDLEEVPSAQAVLYPSPVQ